MTNSSLHPQRCYSCRDCMRPLDPFLSCDTPDMEIVCKGCYTKSYSVTSDWCNMSGGDALKVTGVVMNLSKMMSIKTNHPSSQYEAEAIFKYQ